MDFEAKVEVYIKSDEAKFREKDLELLRAIERYGSINRASSELGRSYSHQQKRIDELENAFGTLIRRKRGGVDGGGSELTDTARILMDKLRAKLVDLAATADTEITEISGWIKNIESDLAKIDTSIGMLSVTKQSWMRLDREIKILIRADTITLQKPSAETKTTARNKITGRVTEIEHQPDKAAATIHLTKNRDTLKATVTNNSIKKLDIEPGKKLTATFKATATKTISIDR